MIRRTSKVLFSGAYIFPGGSLEESDTSLIWHQILGCSIDTIQATSYTQSIDLNSLRIGAIRETWEEVGVLLANGSIPRETKDFLTACRQFNIRPAIEKLHYFTRIITPLKIHKRFDATFFIAIEGNQEIIVDNYESDAFMWGTPDFFLNEYLNKRLSLLPPQIFIIKQLCTYQNLSDLFNRIRSIPRMPCLFQVLQYDDKTFSVAIPGDYRHNNTPEVLKKTNSLYYLLINEREIELYQSPTIQEYYSLTLE